MALEKNKYIRKMEFILTNNELIPQCQCLYNIDVLEDGMVIASRNHRETMDVDMAKQFLNNIQIRKE